MYKSREMTVSKAPDSEDKIMVLDLSGVLAVASCLPECKSLTSLKCAAFIPSSPPGSTP